MKTFSMIREDLKNIRYYYSRQKEMTNSARITPQFVRRRLNFTNFMFVCT